MSISTTFDIRTPDQLTLLGRRWTVPGARASALIIHGVGEHSGRYDEVAGVMNACGVNVMSYDQRGFGQSDGVCGRIPDDLALVRDAAMVFSMLEAESPGGTTPLLVAHSMGGAVAAFAVTSSPTRPSAIKPRAIVLSSPAIQARVNPVEEGFLRQLLKDNKPNFALDSRITPDEVTHDEQVQQAIRADPLMHTVVTPRLVISIVDQGRDALAHAASVQVPALLLVAGDDKLVDPEASHKFAKAMGANAEFHKFDRLFHEVFNERPQDRLRVFAALTAWLNTHA